MEGHCSTGQSPQWALVPMEEEVMTVIKIRTLKEQRIYRPAVAPHRDPEFTMKNIKRMGFEIYISLSDVN